MIDKNKTIAKGHITIKDALTQEVLLDKDNAIHYENLSEALAQSLSNKGSGHIYRMEFGNGATAVDSTGVITYLPTNTNGQNSALYNLTYYKVVDDTNGNNIDPTRNYLQVRHTAGALYTDIFVSCLLDYSEPSGQAAFDNSTSMQGSYIFDEIGLRSYGTDGSDGKLLTHVIFHPLQKSLNRLIQIDYTIRIQTLTNLSSIL